MTLWLYVLMAVSLSSSLNCTPTAAQNVADGSRKMSKVGQELTALYDEYSASAAPQRVSGFRSANPLVRVIDDRVVVDAIASGNAEVLKLDLVTLGMQEAVAVGNIVSGQLPISAIPAVAGLPSLKFVRAAYASLQRGQESGVIK